jgi:hypothetical protein
MNRVAHCENKSVEFLWEDSPFSAYDTQKRQWIKAEAIHCDIKGGRLSVARVSLFDRYFTVKWNSREIGVAKTLEEGKQMGERLYLEGLL